MEKAIPGGVLFLGIVGTTATTTQAMSAANNRQGIRIKLSEALTLSKAKLFVSAVSGTLDGDDMVLDVFSETGATLTPNASLASSATVTATPTGAAWVEWTGFSLALSANTAYWLVCRNAAAVPGTNNFTLRSVNNFPTEPITGLNGGAILARKTSTDGGSTWSAFAAGGASLRLEFSNGTFWGLPYENTATSAVGVGIYSARELGVRFTMPAGVSLRISGVIFPQITSTGSPTGFPRHRLYNDTTLMATGTIFNYLAGSATLGYFDTPQNLLAGQTYRIVVGESTQSDASGNRFNIASVATIENNADSKALMPYSVQQTYLDGTFTDTSTSVIPVSLLLTTGQETLPPFFVPVE